MPFFLQREVKELFQKEGKVLIPELFLPEEVRAAYEEAERRAVRDFGAHEFLMSLIDGGRRGGVLRKIAFSRDMASIGAQLVSANSARFGMEQTILHSGYTDFSFLKARSLKEVIPVQRLLFAYIVFLTDDRRKEEDGAAAGDVLFLKKDYPLSLAGLCRSERDCDVVFYVEEKAVFVPTKPPSFYAHPFQNAGLFYGDLLLDKSYPILYRV